MTELVSLGVVLESKRPRSHTERERASVLSDMRRKRFEGDAKGARHKGSWRRLNVKRPTKEKNDERAKEPKTRRTIDAAAGSVRRQTVGRERKHTQTKEERESGPQMPALDEAGRGDLYMRVRDSKAQVFYAQK